MCIKYIFRVYAMKSSSFSQIHSRNHFNNKFQISRPGLHVISSRPPEIAYHATLKHDSSISHLHIQHHLNWRRYCIFNVHQNSLLLLDVRGKIIQAETFCDISLARKEKWLLLFINLYPS